MNVVDSSGWLEYFADGPGADFFAGAIEDTDQLVVPAICLLEVFKVVMVQRGEDAAVEAVASMQRGKVADVDAAVALAGARLSARLRLPMADSLILAVAAIHEATLWTQDSDFEGLEGVEYLPKE